MVPEPDHSIVGTLARCWGFWIAFLILIGGLLFSCSSRAHDNAQWIQNGNYKNAVGELCCGKRDCGLYVGGTIEHEAGGYRVNATFQVGDGAGAVTYHVEEFVPESDATPSPTGDYWRCQWGGSRKCFFAPPGST